MKHSQNHGAPATGCSNRALLLWGLVALCASLYVALSMGTVWVLPKELISALQQADAPYSTIVRHVRLPRTLMALGCGASLALGGLVFQTIFKNPLAEPYILGLSGGAAVGSLSGMLAGLGLAYTSMCAFAGSLFILGAVLLLRQRSNAESLLLSGVMLNAFCGALVLFLISLLSPEGISSVMQWFMGNLAACSLEQAVYYILFLIPGCLLLASYGHTLNLLSLGEESAQSLGLDSGRAIRLLLVLTSLLISSLVAAVGPIGFIGLIVPQMLRLVCGADCRKLALGCLLFGPAFLIVCDVLARSLSSYSELPSGVVTALVGAPLFIVLQRRLA